MPGCEPFPPPEGMVLDVGPEDDLVGTVASAPEGATVSLADGSYDLAGSAVWIDTPGVTLRSASGNADAVILDGGYDSPSGGVVNVASVDDVAIADITIRRARYHAIHVTASEAAANGVRIYNVHLIDPGEQALKINHADMGFFADGGEVACSRIELSDAGREQVMQYESSGSFCYTGGIDAHGAQGWTVRDNVIGGFWCSNDDLSEHGIHFWTGSRDTVVVRNVLIDNARGIGFGLTEGGRSYDDDPCAGITNASHYGGLIANNFIVGTRGELFDSPSGMDQGIGLSYACDAAVVHNSIAASGTPLSAIEWRFEATQATVVNNLMTHDVWERDGATATQAGNLEGASIDDFVAAASYDLHLAEGAAALGQGAPDGADAAPTDIDGDARPATPDVGADQR
jgi:hypothetical protein